MNRIAVFSLYIVVGIAYAGEPKTPVKVAEIKALSNYKLWLRFNNGESKVFDFKPLLDSPCYIPLKNFSVFAMYILITEYPFGVTVILILHLNTFTKTVSNMILRFSCIIKKVEKIYTFLNLPNLIFNETDLCPN